MAFVSFARHFVSLLRRRDAGAAEPSGRSPGKTTTWPRHLPAIRTRSRPVSSACTSRRAPPDSRRGRRASRRDPPEPAGQLGQVSLHVGRGHAQPARPVSAGTPLSCACRTAAAPRGARCPRRERGGAELAVVAERVAGHDERGAFAAAFQVQPERFRELFTVVAPDPATHPVRLGLIQVSGVHDRVIDQPAAHPPARFPARLRPDGASRPGRRPHQTRPGSR